MNRYSLAAAVLGALAGLLLTVANAPQADTWYPNVGKVNPNREVRMDPSAVTSILQGHADPDAAGTTIKATLDGWKSVYLFNDSTVNCCATFDASAPATTAGGKCTRGSPLKAGEGASRDYGFPYPVRVACSGLTDATTGADIVYEITK